MDILQNIFAFIVAIAILVTIHEFGHFWVAKKLGIKILRFSVGFGKPLYSKRFGADNTEFVIAAIPLGGYVKMLDEREAPVPPYQRHRAFNTQPVLSRIAVVAAGPMFNFIFAVFAYWMIFSIGVEGLKPLIGKIQENTPAAIAGIAVDDQIMSVGGEETPTWTVLLQKCINHIVHGEPFKLVTKNSSGIEKELQLDLSSIHIDDLSKGNLLEEIGLEPKRFPIPAQLDTILAGSPAEKSGLKSNDLIVAADGVGISNWTEWVSYVQARPEQTIVVKVMRDEQSQLLRLTPEKHLQDDKPIGRIGAKPKRVTIGADYLGVEKYGPMKAIGKGIDKTWNMSVLTLKLMGKMIMGDVSVENISGPISIAQYAGQSASIGLIAFLSFLAIVSISLGVLNLLPIPILDGGHLFYYFIELIIGKPVSESVQLVGQNIGVLLLVAMMSLAFYNDIMRLLP